MSKRQLTKLNLPMMSVGALASSLLWSGQANAAFDLLMEAESMPVKTVGQSYGGVHNIWANGYIEQTVSFPAGGQYRFDVKAQGTSAGGVFAKFEIRIDGVKVAERSTSSTSMQTYSATVQVSGGNHKVAIAFVNDAIIGSEDRNLIVDNVRVVGLSTSTPAPTPVPGSDIPRTPATIEAEDMEKRTVGQAADGFHNIWGNGSPCSDQRLQRGNLSQQR